MKVLQYLLIKPLLTVCELIPGSHFFVDDLTVISQLFETKAESLEPQGAIAPLQHLFSAHAELRLALVQLSVGASKSENLLRAASKVAEAAKSGAQLVALPECCNSPYGNTFFPEYAEPIPGPSTEAFSKAAADNCVFLVAGSIPEREGDKLYNTCTVFDPKGTLIAKYRKSHLFDIDVPGKITFQESKTLSPGNALSTFETPFGLVGIGICYDIRFPEMAQLYTRRGCRLLLYPGAFNMTTGPAHWELLARGRAVDNQLYVATISPARDETASYIAWGHSTLVSPWGEVVSKAEHAEQVIYADLDPQLVEDIRQQIPVSRQKRTDMYDLKDVSSL
ncbi:hypothetical protein CAPTEDRAFT_196103 [Capitella teleta]|uniref:omega-amidase n=1 Tax=Capitella teleta TaxID=283909 RepID=R7TU67_CAPTE|nr:hypothetical protein CAPTEDRAFT_196103 [Capitella teleta]|eukprot:ELT97214.1 hypothetical protein CAPTEDRAFT_196103 [Capitella teleta]